MDFQKMFDKYFKTFSLKYIAQVLDFISTEMMGGVSLWGNVGWLEAECNK